MNLPRPFFSLPLLTKDLIEQAAHRRTYVLRVVYAPKTGQLRWLDAEPEVASAAAPRAGGHP